KVRSSSRSSHSNRGLVFFRRPGGGRSVRCGENLFVYRPRLVSRRFIVCPPNGLHYNERAAPGAQTERRGQAGPVRSLRGREGLTGRFFSPPRAQRAQRSDAFNRVSLGVSASLWFVSLSRIAFFRYVCTQ